MKANFILFFLLLGLLQFGILLNALTAYRSEYRPQSLKYWSIALAFSAVSYTAFAVALATSEDLLNNSNILVTVGNTLIFASVIFQGLFARTLRSYISARVIWIIVSVIMSYGIIFEFVRHYGTFESRTATVGFLLFSIYIWQIGEIRATRNIINSFNLDVLLWLVSAEALFIFARIIAAASAGVDIQIFEQIPLVVSLLLWIQLTLNVLTYVTMIGFWVEEITKRNVEAELENTKIKTLLFEKDRLLNDLVQTKKIAELGAMSASISHEINQPLASIKLNAWSMKRMDESVRNLTVSHSQLLDQMVKDIDRLADIVETLRRVFRDRASDVGDIDIQVFLNKLKPLMLAEMDSRSIALHFDLPMSLQVRFNESELTLVVLNLVSNAAKSGADTIRIVGHHQSGQVIVTVQDNGNGISADKVSHLFEINKERSETGGLGLGLWLCRYLMERGDGTIDYQGMTPKGSAFNLTFSRGNA